MRNIRIILLALLLIAGCAKDRYSRPPDPNRIPLPPPLAEELPTFSPDPNSDPSVAFGLPISHRDTLVLRNMGYTVGYSVETNTAIWVAYRVFANAPSESGPRPSRFLRDERVSDPVTHDDYTHSGYDRGHLAPSAAIARRHGPAAQRETFLMTNIVPQVPGLNQRGWQAVEALVDREWAEELRELWVFTGPIFDENCIELESDVRIPAAFYKLLVDSDESTGAVHALGVVMPQERIDEVPLSEFIVTVDAIEAATQIDFLSELQDGLEDAVEAAVPDARWDIHQTLEPRFPGAARPLRYRPCD